MCIGEDSGRGVLRPDYNAAAGNKIVPGSHLQDAVEEVNLQLTGVVLVGEDIAFKGPGLGLRAIIASQTMWDVFRGR